MLLTGKLTLAYSNFFFNLPKTVVPKELTTHYLMEIRIRQMTGRERTLKLKFYNIPECGFNVRGIKVATHPGYFIAWVQWVSL